MHYLVRFYNIVWRLPEQQDLTAYDQLPKEVVLDLFIEPEHKNQFDAKMAISFLEMYNWCGVESVDVEWVD
jgi:hypothetical protein